jgi:hypothetical protein
MSPAHRSVWSPPRARAAASLGLLGSLVLAGLGCRSTDEDLPYTERGGWRTHVVYEGELPLYGLAAGDIDRAAPGDELVAVGAEGEIVYVARDGPEFQARQMGDWGDGVAVELVQVAIGDVDRMLPGAEIVVVGARVDERSEHGPTESGDGAEGSQGDGGEVVGVAYLLVRDGEGFTCTELHSATAPLLSVLVADLDPAFAGNEVALAGDGREVVLLVSAAEGFEARKIADLPGAGRAMAATDAGLVVACDDGSLVWLARPEPPPGLPEPGVDVVPWRAMHTWRAEGALVSVAARGRVVLVCGEDGVLRLFQIAGAGPDIAFVRETRCLTLDVELGGAALAEIDAREAGDEALAVADDGTVHVVRITPWPVADDVVPASAGFENYRVHAEVVADDTEPLRALAAGRFAPFQHGAVGASQPSMPQPSVVGLVCTGASGRILLVTHTVAAEDTR